MRIQAYELAFHMQRTAPELVDLSGETAHTRAMYGLDEPQTAGFGRQCLFARRLVERGVRYTLLVHGVQITPQSWDDHSDTRHRMPRRCRRSGPADRGAVDGSQAARTPRRDACCMGV